MLRPTPTGPFLSSPRYYTSLAPTGPSSVLVIANWDLDLPTPSPGPADSAFPGLLVHYTAGPPPPFNSGLRDEDRVVRGT